VTFDDRQPTNDGLAITAAHWPPTADDGERSAVGDCMVPV